MTKALEQYNDNLAEIEKEIKQIQLLLERHKKLAKLFPDNWAFTVDLAHVIVELSKVRKFLLEL